jgi:energy-coupling factor transporter ATP-binding protein EcfA2
MKNTYISSISLDSFAGRSRRHDFAPGVNLIIGANGAGKTTISNAINFVLSGKVPGLPKTNGGIMDALGSGLRMGAALDIGGKTYDRSLTRSGKSVKGEAKSPAPADLLPSPMLDLGPFLEASPKVRAGMILGACGDDVPAKLRALLAETGLEKLIGRVPSGDDVQEWLASVENLAKATATGYTASMKDMRGTLAGMEVLDTSTPAHYGPPISELRANVSRLEREIATLTGEANAISARPSPVQPLGERPNGTAEAFEAQLAEVQGKIRTAQADLATARAEWQAWSRWQAESLRLDAKLAEAQAAYQVVTDGWEAADEAKLKADIDELLMQSDRLQTKLNAANNDELTGKGTCPCCGALAVHWNRQAAEVADVAGWEEAMKQNADRIKTLHNLLRQATTVSRSSEAVLRADQTIADHWLTSPNQGAGITEADIQGLQDALADLTESADALTAEARRARAWDGYLAAHLQYAKGQERVVEINAELRQRHDIYINAIAALQAAEASQAAQAQAEARQATRRQAEERLAGLEADEAAFKAARLAWDAGVKAIMDHALRGVLNVCQTFTAGLFAAPLTVHDLCLGRYEDQSWVTFDAFSGSDKRIATAAIQAALAANHQGFKLVIVDEFGVVDPGRKSAVLANLAAAVEAGLVDQVMVFDNRDIDGVPEGINEIHLA